MADTLLPAVAGVDDARHGGTWPKLVRIELLALCAFTTEMRRLPSTACPATLPPTHPPYGNTPWPSCKFAERIRKVFRKPGVYCSRLLTPEMMTPGSVPWKKSSRPPSTATNTKLIGLGFNESVYLPVPVQSLFTL